MEYILIFITAVFVNNIVLAQFLGICPFLGVSKKVDTAIGMSAAVTFVLTIATIVTYLVQKYVLDAFKLLFVRVFNPQFTPKIFDLMGGKMLLDIRIALGKMDVEVFVLV